MNIKKDTSWDEQAKWYNKLVGEDGTYYHKEVIVPEVLKQLGDITNKKILDLGCGQGFFCRILANHKAIVTGIDLSKSLIEYAKKYSKYDNISYYVANAEDLSFLEANSFDIVVSILSLGNIRNLQKTFENVYSLLKDKGRFIFVIMHPCFRIPRQSHWGYDENQKLQYRRIDRYMTSLEIPIITHPGKVKEKKELKDQDYTIMFHRSLTELFYCLNQSKLLVSYLKELCSNKMSVGKRAKAENRARKEIPLFLLIESIKILI